MAVQRTDRATSVLLLGVIFTLSICLLTSRRQVRNGGCKYHMILQQTKSKYPCIVVAPVRLLLLTPPRRTVQDSNLSLVPVRTSDAASTDRVRSHKEGTLPGDAAGAALPVSAVRNHIYSAAAPAGDPRSSCDFTATPDVWTDPTTAEDASVVQQARKENVDHPTSGCAVPNWGSGDANRAAWVCSCGHSVCKLDAYRCLLKLSVQAPNQAISGALWGSAEAQAAIWEHQHPADCHRQHFLLHRPQVTGSFVHLAQRTPED